MVSQSLNIQLPYINSMVVSPTWLLESALHFLNTASGTEVLLTILAATFPIITVMLLWWLIAKQKHVLGLKEQIAELTATNEKLQQEIAELNGEEIDLLEGIIDAEIPKMEIPGFNPQELKALSELAKRLK